MLNQNIVLLTLQRYLKEHTQSSVEFILKNNMWSPLRFNSKLTVNASQPKSDHLESCKYSCLVYGIYPPLSVLYKKKSARAIDLLRSHYFGVRTVKAFFQSIYFTLLKIEGLQSILIPAFCYVKVGAGSIENLDDNLGSFIFGGLGSKVKIFNFRKGTIINILKEGYDDRYILNEISIRKKFGKILPIPDMISVNENAKSYEERYIDASLIRNLDNRTIADLLRLFDKLLKYYKSNSITTLQTAIYRNSIIKEISVLRPEASHKTQLKISNFLSIIESHKSKGADETTIMVEGHGDFWVGNIIRERVSRKLLIIDWERAGQYSLMNDFYTLISMYAIENEDDRIIINMFKTKTKSGAIFSFIDKLHKHFSIRRDKTFLESQLLVTILEKIRYSLQLMIATPYTKLEVEKEIDNWIDYFMELYNKEVIFRNE